MATSPSTATSVTDQAMPVLSGEQFTRELLETRPDLPVVICTGYSERLTAERARQIGARALVNKPLDRALLARLMREALDRG